MKTKMAMKLIVLGVIIVAVSHWLRGHDILTGLALSLLFLAVVFKVAFALIIRRRRIASEHRRWRLSRQARATPSGRTTTGVISRRRSET